MRGALAAYCAGVLLGSYLVQLQASLLISGSLAAVCLAVRHWLLPARTITRYLAPALLWLALFFTGLAYHAAWGLHASAARLPSSLIGTDISITGVIVNLPQRGDPATRFLFRVSNSPDVAASLRGQRILLSDYGGLSLAGGQRWCFTVRLRAPRGLANPGTFDYEAWLMQQGIRALGYVRDPDVARQVGIDQLSLAAWRQRLAERIRGLTAADPVLAMLMPALVLGERGQISSAMWETFTRTGTNHLFVISGLHVGMLAAWCFLLISYGCRLLPGTPWSWPCQKLGALAAILGALGYSLLAGFGLPAQRAMVMVAVLMLGSVSGTSINLPFRFLLALVVVLSLNPQAGNGAGFWLSFSAVAALLLFLTASRSKDSTHRIRDTLLKPQYVVFLALFLPLSVWMGQVSLIAPVVNMVAIPILAGIIVPLSLLAVLVSVISEPAAALLVALLQQVLGWTINGIHWLGQIAGHWSGYLQFLPSSWAPVTIVLAALALLLLLLPLPWSARWLALPLSFAYLAPQNAATDKHGLSVHILDVGQGLAVLVERSGRYLLYDTGARYSPDFDMGSAVVLPVLRRLGVSELDWLIISHGDNDHAGGFTAIAEQLPIRQLLLGEDLASDTQVPSSALPCRAGQRWHWQGVEIAVLHPDRVYEASNDNSCVVRLAYGDQSLLLSGDITRAVERQLVARFGPALDSDLLVAPHHGSRTSSSYPLLKTVAPDWAIFSAAVNNSFGHPASDVVARYRALGIATLNTAETGMISVQLGVADPTPVAFRNQYRRYWRWSQNPPSCRYYNYHSQVCSVIP